MPNHTGQKLPQPWNGYVPPPQYSTQQRQPYPPNSTPPRRTPPRQKKKGSSFVARGLFVLILLAAIVVGTFGYTAYREIMQVEESGTFYPNVYLDNIPLNGMTLQGAYEYFTQRTQENLGSFLIVLAYEGLEWRIDAQTLGMFDQTDSSIREELTNAYMIGRAEGSMIDRYRTLQSLKAEPYYAYTANVEKNMDQIEPMLLQIEQAAYVAPQNAGYSFDPDRETPLYFTPEQAGQMLDTETLREQVRQMIAGMTSGTIQITPVAVMPEITVAALQQQIALIGRCETEISTSSTEARNNNIRRGVSSFHGKQVAPGEKVSFNDWVGTRTLKNGFYEAVEIVRGNYEMGVGGGICQVSSTLYGAVVNANLSVVERRNHGIPVGYLDMGADATVSDGRIDFVFRNDTDYTIYIIARLEETKNGKKCVFEIYGRPDTNGYTYGMRHELIETLPIPEAEYIKDKNGEYVVYEDEEKVTFKGAEGYRVKTYRVTRDANGTVLSDEEWYTDTYKARSPVIYVGTTPRWID